jgi:hypothetical protein
MNWQKYEKMLRSKGLFWRLRSESNIYQTKNYVLAC